MYRPNPEIAAPFDQTWNAVIDYLAEQSISIVNMERASGLIVSMPVSIPVPQRSRGEQKLADCGSIIGIPIYPDAAVWNVVVRGDSLRSTVRPSIRFTHLNPDTRQHDACTSAGILEARLEAAVRARVETRQPPPA